MIVVALTYGSAIDVSAQDLFTYKAESTQLIVSKGNVTIATSSVKKTVFEKELASIESRECTALLKRDTTTLRLMWARDFTLDEAPKGLVIGKNDLPFYNSFHRFIEKVTDLNTIALVSGQEFFQVISPSGKPGKPMKRKFFHTWTKIDGLWMLTTNIHE